MDLSRNRTLHRAAMLTVIALVSLMAGGQPSRIEYALLDLRFAVNRALGTSPPAVEAAVVLVSPESERRLDDVYGSSWRRWYAGLVSDLSDAGARGVVWDATFLAAEPEFDPALATAFEQLPVVAAENGYERNNPVIRAVLDGVGWKQFIVVQSLPRRTIEETSVPALGFVAAEVARGERRDPGPDRGPAEESVWLDFSFDVLTTPTFDIADVVLAGDERLADADATPFSVFSNRVVFIGTDLPGADRYPIPGTRGRPVAGVLAQVVSMWSHLEVRQITRVEGWMARALAFLAGALVVAAGSARHRRWRRAAIAVTFGVVLVAPPAAFAVARVWLPASAMIVTSLIAWSLLAISQRFQLTRNYRQSLGFDPRLLEDQRVAASELDRGVERDAVVLCADIRNYTQFVTDTPPDEVQRVMSRYMSTMEALVHRHGGYINKFVGDEIIAVFGFPLSEREATERGIRTAHEMLLTVHELNAEFGASGLPVLDGIGVGLDRGPLRFITIGGSRRLQFDVIGTPINGASRLQALTKQMGHPLIVSSEIARDQSHFAVEGGSSGEGTSEQGPHPHGSAGPDGERPRLTLEFIGEVMIRGQGRRRLFGLPSAGIPLSFASQIV